MFALFGPDLNKARCVVKKGNTNDFSLKYTDTILDGKGPSGSSTHDGVVHLLPCVPRIVERFQEDFAIFNSSDDDGFRQARQEEASNADRWNSSDLHVVVDFRMLPLHFWRSLGFCEHDDDGNGECCVFWVLGLGTFGTSKKKIVHSLRAKSRPTRE